MGVYGGFNFRIKIVKQWFISKQKKLSLQLFNIDTPDLSS